MILYKVTLENWRAHQQFEAQFGPHLNVIEGGNEAGKSTLVEALDWALYRDVFGVRLASDAVRAIVPALDVEARPRVEIEVEFADCRAILSKTLSEDAAKRECVLTIARELYPDSVFEKAEAQTRWKLLLAADGLGEERGVAQGALLVAHQGEGVDFLTDGGSAIRSTLGVGSDGELALTRRLDEVRGEVERMRKRELTLDLSARAVDAARANTDAARARDELKRAQNERAKTIALTGEIEAIRDDIAALAADWEAIAPRENRAQRRIGELGDLMTKQMRADAALKEAEVAARDANLARQSMQKRSGEIARLEAEQARAARELDEVQKAVAAGEARVESARERAESLRARLEAGELAHAEAEQIAGAWRAVYDVFEAQGRVKEAQTALAELERLSARAAETEAAFRGAEKAPSFEELRHWRVAFDEWQRLQNEAVQGLQIEISPHVEKSARWKADRGEVEQLELAPGTKICLRAMGRGVFELEGAAVFRFATGARGIEEVGAELEQARASLEELLAPWQVPIADLPGAIGEYETRRQALERAERARDEARAELEREEKRSGVAARAGERLDAAQSEFAELKEVARPLEDLIAFRGLKRAHVKVNWDEAHRAERELGSGNARARGEVSRAQHELSEAQAELGRARNRPDALRAAMDGRADQLERLREGEENSDDAARLGELGAQYLKADRERERRADARQELGDAVSQWRVEEARRAALELAGERGDIEKALVNLRADLRHACDQDAETRLSELEAEIAQWEPEVAAHEARLRGLALLHAAIEGERARLSRDLAGPIGAKLSPWLGRLRGKPTQLRFDGAGTRIENVETTETAGLVTLPFGEHSEGMKEQVAFALRLILAERVAKNLPSKRLPVTLDDPFTQSDRGRREGLGEVLQQAGEHLQIIFVTCHDAPPAPDGETRFLRLGAGLE